MQAREGARPPLGAASAGRSAGLLMRLDDATARRRRAPPRVARRERRRRGPGRRRPGRRRRASRKGVFGISSRMRSRCSGAVAPVTAPTSARPDALRRPSAPRPRDEVGDPLPQRPALGELEVHEIRPRPGFDVRTRTKPPRSRGRAPRSTSGSRASAPSSGLAVKASAPRPGTVPAGEGSPPRVPAP